MLKRLRVAPETSAANYDRAAFPLWIAQGACDTREEVLIREREQGAPQSCDVRRGKWFSAYDGLTITNPSKLDIDHVVPLQQAFVSGASKWDLSTRKQFANDLGYAGSLRAVSAASNRSKGSDDPARWMPPRSAFRCSYVGTWIAIKFRWQLKVDQAEMSTLKLWVNKCGSHSDVRKPKRVRVSFSRRDLARPTRRKHARARGKGSDPRFATCAEAKSHGYGPYRSGADPEYNWYRDSDGDGRNCE